MRTLPPPQGLLDWCEREGIDIMTTVEGTLTVTLWPGQSIIEAAWAQAVVSDDIVTCVPARKRVSTLPPYPL